MQQSCVITAAAVTAHMPTAPLLLLEVQTVQGFAAAAGRIWTALKEQQPQLRAKVTEAAQSSAAGVE